MGIIGPTRRYPKRKGHALSSVRGLGGKHFLHRLVYQTPANRWDQVFRHHVRLRRQASHRAVSRRTEGVGVLVAVEEVRSDTRGHCIAEPMSTNAAESFGVKYNPLAFNAVMSLGCIRHIRHETKHKVELTGSSEMRMLLA